jgi:glucosamine-6-phosphate deaminase
MEVILQPDAERAARLAAAVVARAVREKPGIVLGLATGRTMEPVYAALAAARLDFSGCRAFLLDEYVGVAADDARSFRATMRRQLFDRVNFERSRIDALDGTAPDLEAECARYEAAIGAAGGIDLQLLGLGTDGHIGFNEPLSALRSRTRVKALTPATIAQNAPFFGGAERVPRRAITMGVGTILEARRCLLLATGAEKAEILARAVEGPITAMVTASALQLHPRCTVIVDEAAAARLQGRDYYRWIFETEPEWREFRG